MAKVPDLVSPVVPQKLPDQPEAPVPNDIQTDDLHYSEENNKHFKTPDAMFEQSEDVWIEETLDMKGPIYVPPAFESYCNKKFVTSRCWNNLAVKDIGPEELGVSSLKGHLEELFPFPSSQRSSEERLKIYQESTHGVSHSSNCVRAFLSLAFPPIVVCKNAAYEFTSLTFINDVIPQFTAVCYCSPRNRTRVSIKCVICPYYEELCVKRGTFSRLSKVNHHEFDGVAQAIVHQKTKVHQMAALFFTGSTSNKDFSQLKEGTHTSTQKTIFEALKIKERDSIVTQCLGFYENKEVVETFKDDVAIRRISCKLLFERERAKGKYQCFLEQGHEKCVSWAGWKAKHAEEAERLSETRSGRAVYVLLNREIFHNGTKQNITGTIKSLDPPCTGKPSGNPKHPFTCNNCHKQQHYLLDLFNKRSEGKLKNTVASRLGKKGFRHDYAKTSEVKASLHSLSIENKNLSQTVTAMKKRERSVQSWEEMLHESCKHGYQEKLIVDLLTLFKQDIDLTRPVQISILTNLVGKLKGTVNHHYIPLIKTIGKMHKIRLGECNYKLTKDLFGLPCGTTCDNFNMKEKLQPGYNPDVLEQAACFYLDGPVIEASDEARALRFLQAVQNGNGEVILIGNSWSGDIDKWEHDVLQIPRTNSKLGDKDDFSALQRTVQGIVDGHKLAAKVAIHNLCNLTGEKSQPLVYLMWPTPKKGYSGTHLLKIWQKVRRDCAEKKVSLVGHSTDSAGFSLSASVQLMTPTESTVAEGIYYLGLGIPDERFVAPYFWRLPSISYGDYDHLRRTFLRVLKYDTRDLTFFKDSRGSVVATISHLQELMSICKESGQNVPFSANDLLLISFFDQRPDTANRIFTLKVAEMLHAHVMGSEGTCLYLTAVYYLTEPFFDANFGTPEEIQKALSTGITIFRLWKKYLEIKKMKLHSQANAAKIKEKRGHFITYGAYTTAELLFSAGAIHSLAMYLHFKNLGPKACSLHRTGTIATERIIGQLQGKTNQIQSLDTAPTFAEMINKTKDLAFLNEALSELSSYDCINIPATSNRKLSHFRTSKVKPKAYQYPESYEEFLERQQYMHREGVKAAQDLVQELLPPEFQSCLMENSSWEFPYKFPKPEGIVIVSNQPPTYEKLDVSLDSKTLDTIQAEVDMEDHAVEREEEFILPTADCGKEEEEADNNRMDVETNTDEDSDEEESLQEQASKTISQRKQKWYIKRNQEMIHINKALKLLIPREFISKERSRRHWITSDLHKAMTPIDPAHDIIQFRDVAVANGDTYFIVHILSILSEESKELVSTSSKSKCFVRGHVYKNSACNQYGFMTSVFVSKWLPVRRIIAEVTLEKNAGGFTVLSENSQMDLNNWLSKSIPLSDGDLQSSEENDDDEFYEVEKILEVRLNKKYHSEEYKVRFKGYGPEDDMWLPSSSFREPVQFQTVSQRGRVRQHTTKDESEGPPKKAGQLDVQKHGTKNSKGRLSNNINDKNTKSLDVKSRKRCQRKRKDTSFQPHGGKKGKYPTDDFGPETSGAIEIDVECGTTSLPLPKPSDSNTLAQERDRGVKRKKGKKKSNGSKFRKSLVSTFNSSKVTLTDSEDDSSLPEKGGLPQQVQGSKDVVGPSMVCCGSFHQSEHEDFHYPGQQCAAMALTALLYTTVKPIDTWQGSDIDYVLLVGDKLHFLQLCHIGRSVHSDSKLALDELPSDVQCFKFQFSVKTEITGGTIDKKQTIGADDLAGLEEIFENCQECKAVGVVLRILEYTLACAHSYSMWYVIDSHARDSSGMINDQGSSVVIQFPNYMSLLHYIRCFVEHATSERDINQNDLTFEALTLQVRERKPISSEEHLILPVTTLLTYRTSLGGIDLFNTFASCLERGKKINDDLLDFFLISTAENQLNQIMKKQIFIFNSCFYKKLIQFNPQAIRKWTKDTDIFSKKYLFMPICKDLHWLLVIIKNGRTTSIMILDSLNGEHALLEKRVKRYLQDEWAAKEKQQPRGTKKPLAIEEIHYPLVPKQTNDKDCGLYVMKCFEEFLKDSENKPFESWRPNFSQRDTTLLRKTIKFFIQEEISKLH